MATVLKSISKSTKTDTRLEQELATVARRIRLNDVLVGVFTLALVALGYAVAGVVLDNLYELPDWMRQVGLLGFSVVLATIVYTFIVRPMRRFVNPRFAARQIESTVPDAKNAIINWVDLQGAPLADGVRRAVGAKAAEGVENGDTKKAAESRTVIWLGGAVGLLVATLAVLFVVFKPAPFFSHLTRTFNPFTTHAIATRTTIQLTEPKDGDVTVTLGSDLVVAVFVDGSLPDPEGADRVRLQVRYNPESPDFDEHPLQPGSSNREWQLRLPQSVIQNGLWYRVVAGDGRTAEHRIIVRSKPLAKEFVVRYDYPAYTRILPETSQDRVIEAYRGTNVTLTVRTNRAVKGGWASVPAKAQNVTIPSEPVADDPQALRFRFSLQESGRYQIGFTTTDDEISEPTPPIPVKVLDDAAPTVTIAKPAEDQITLPANGLLEVDGVVGDDFGVTGIKLVVRIQGDKKPLVEKVHRDRAALERAADKSFPTSVETKDSVPLATLSKDNPLGLAPDTVLEYWVEATDNSEPKANVGRSPIRTVKLGAPVTEKPKQEQIKNQQTQRANTEQQHRANQDNQFKNEPRDPKQLHQDKNPPPNGAAEPMPPEGMNPPMAQDAMGQPMNQNGMGEKVQDGMNQAIQDQAKQIEQKLNEQKNQPGQARPDPMAQQPEAPPADRKSGEPPPEGATAEPKSAQQPDPMNPQTGNAAESKGTGQPQSNPTEKPMTQGEERPQPEANPASTPPEQQGGTAKSNKPPEAATTKEPPKADMNPMSSGGMSESKSPPQDMGTESASPKNQGTSSPMNGGAKSGEEKPVQTANKTPSNDGAKPKMDRKELDQALRDLASDDEKKQQAARDKLDQSVGKENRERAERIAKDMKSRDEQTRNNAQKEAGELSRELDRDGEAAPPPKDENVERLLRDKARDLNSPDDAKRQQAERDVDNAVGREGRDELQKASRNLNSTNPMEKQEAEKNVDELAKKQSQKKAAEQQAQKNGENKLPPKKQDELSKKASDLNSQDMAKREAAEKEFDQAIGEKERKDLQQQLAGKNGDESQKATKEKLDQLAKQGNNGQKPDPKNLTPEQQKEFAKQMEQLKKDAQDLNSSDMAKRDAAEKKFDNMIGKEKREQLQKDLKDMGTQQAANQKLEDLAKQNAQSGAGQQQPDPKTMTEEQKKEFAKQMDQLKKDAQDLNSADPQKRDAAEKKFDNLIGKDKREELQKNLKETNGQQAANQKIEDAAKQASQSAGAKPDPKTMTEEQKKEFAKQMEQMKKDAQDLKSDDPKTRAAAEQKFDKAIGKEKREQLQKDLKSMDMAKQDAANQTLEDLAKQNAGAGKPDPKNMTEEQKKEFAKQMEQLKKDAENLASNDEKTRKEAEQKLDNQLGKDKREQLQKDMQDLKSNDPARQQAARDRLEEMAKKWNPGAGASQGPEEKLHQDDLKNRLKSAELQLTKFEDAKKNAEAVKELGYTPEQYDEFLKGYRRVVEGLRDEVAKAENPGAPKQTGPATVRVGEGANQKLDHRTDTAGGANVGAGGGKAPEGYSEAQRRFAEAAAKQKSR